MVHKKSQLLKKLLSTDILGNTIGLKYQIRNFVTKEGIKKQEFQTFMDGDNEEEWFDFKIAFLENDLIKITDMFVGKEKHRKKGIPEALILEVKRLYGKNKIISSSNKNKLIKGEWRREAATKAWERLVSRSLAKYDFFTDTYELL